MKAICPLCGCKDAENWAVTIKCPTENCRNAYQPLIDETKKKKKDKKLRLELEIEELERQVDPLLGGLLFRNTSSSIDYNPLADDEDHFMNMDDD